MLNGRVLKKLEIIFGKENVLREAEAVKKLSRDYWPANLLERECRQTASAAIKPNGSTYNRQIQELVLLAIEYDIKIVARGGGSCVTGAANAERGEIILDMSGLRGTKMISQPSKESHGLLSVQAGAMGGDIDAALSNKRLTSGHESASYHIASFGGSVQCGGSGQFSCRFGKIADIVSEVSGINGIGEYVSLRGENLKDVLGLEGTTLIVTGGLLPVFEMPPRDGYLSFSFDDLENNVEFLKKLYGMRAELEESGVTVYAVRCYDFLDYKFIAKPYKGDSAKPGWYKQIEYLFEKAMCAGRKPLNKLDAFGLARRRGWMPWTGLIYLASDSETKLCAASRLIEGEILALKGKMRDPAIAEMWHKHRFKLGYDKLVAHYKAGIIADTFDCAPTWDNLASTYEKVRDALFAFGIAGAHIGMDLDGPYIYFTFASLGRSERRYREIWEAALLACAGNGARTNHHHGIGKLKAGKLNSFAPFANGDDWYRAAKDAKKRHDPHLILNPNNLFNKNNLA